MGKTFSDLIADVQEKGKCVHCGGCVSFCSAINYGALTMDAEGKPGYADQQKCLECGLCYAICPQTPELDGEIRQKSGWQPPIGNVASVNIARARDANLRKDATDGGVVTAILLYLLNTGRIDGAIVSQNTDLGRAPCLAKTEAEIRASAGSHFGSSQGMAHFSNEFATFSPSLEALGEYREANPERIAFVGTPCQIITVRKMQALGIVPSDTIIYSLGLFCSGNFSFTADMFKTLEKKFNFTREDICKINIKDDFVFSFFSGGTVSIPIPELDTVRRHACNFCDDFSAEYADISFGGLGAENGWTTVVTRSDTGRDLFMGALEKVLEPYRYEDNPKYITQAEEKIFRSSERKKQSAGRYRDGLPPNIA